MSEQAIRIFEALSDVDQELLERCNQKAGRENGAVHRLIRKYGRAMAAGICLLVVGAASWGGYQLIISGSGSNSSGSAQFMDAAPAEQFNMASSIAAEDRDVESENSKDGLEDNTVGNGTMPAAGMPGNGTEAAEEAVTEGWKTDGIQAESNPVTATSPEAAKQQTVDQLQAEMASSVTSSNNDNGSNAGSSADEKENQADRMAELRELEKALLDSRQVIPWEEASALKPFDSYLPSVLPAGYEPFSARRSAMPDLSDDVIFKWCDGEQIFYMSMTQGEAVTKEDLERRDGLHEYLAEDFRKELIPDSMPAGEPISFTLYYADGMRIYFNGYLTADEMWDVVQSISK